MSLIRYIMLVSAIAFSTIGFAAYLVQAIPGHVKSTDEEVQDGMKVTVQFHISLQDHPTTTYSDTQQFIQGQHSIPPGLEQRIAGMHPGERKTFPLSAEEGFGPHDVTKLHMIPRSDLPLHTQEGDIIADDAGRHAQIVRILPEGALIDLNHPLAGQPLILTLQIVTVENPDKGETHIPSPAMTAIRGSAEVEL